MGVITLRPLYITRDNVRITAHRRRFVVNVNDSREEYSAIKLSYILILSENVMLTLDAIRLALNNDIPILISKGRQNILAITPPRKHFNPNILLAQFSSDIWSEIGRLVDEAIRRNVQKLCEIYDTSNISLESMHELFNLTREVAEVLYTLITAEEYVNLWRNSLNPHIAFSEFGPNRLALKLSQLYYPYVLWYVGNKVKGMLLQALSLSEICRLYEDAVGSEYYDYGEGRVISLRVRMLEDIKAIVRKMLNPGLELKLFTV